MARSDRETLKALAKALSGAPHPRGDYYEKVIDATASQNRMVTGVCALLAVGVVFLLFRVDFSPWAGAALVVSWAFFTVGFASALMHVVSYHKMLLLADAVAHGDDTVELGSGEEEASPEAVVREEAIARRLHSSENHFLLIGLVCTGAAVAIDRWHFAWRGFIILAGVALLFVLVDLIPHVIRFARRRSGDVAEEREDEARE